MPPTVGSLVRARGREWIVLPESTDDFVVARPLGGSDEEVAGISPAIESIEPAQFGLPDPSAVGDHRSCRLLRDAVRLSSRSAAGPFRSFGRIAVEPRPYQLVPLLMALRQDPVRLLIADDVGIGKTIEACLIARELLDRGEIRRLGVLCPPHLAEQWQRELKTKFHLEPELVLPGTAGRLERSCRVGQSLFDVHPLVIVSMDFIKSDRRRDDFVRAAPEFLIVDEAHTCAFAAERGARHQRYQLLRSLAADASRHLVLVTATPHSGKEDAFRALLALINPSFAELPPDLAGKENEQHRRRVAAHLIQRRRGDIRHFMKEETPFPEREEAEETYQLSPPYRALFDKIIRYARETIIDRSGERRRYRIRWWSALALLRSVGSSPAAAAATLRSRASSAEGETPEEADEIGRRSVLDLEPDEESRPPDVPHGADPGEENAEASLRRRLLELAGEADALQGAEDTKVQRASRMIRGLLGDGFSPIVFCRFIPTAEYVAEELRKRLPKGVEVEAVTGTLPPADREARVQALAQAPRRVLVATDCLSEGINLQDHFDAVMHYDLSWNPTRHEQREGRVDRYGQRKPKVRVVTYFGSDNPIDGIVLQVLLNKHKKIRSSLGISVPVPVDTNAVLEALFEGLLLREKGGKTAEELLPGFEEYLKPKREDLFTRWDAAAEREKRSRTLFAQETIKVDEVARELAEVRSVIGSPGDVRDFVLGALRAHGGSVGEENGTYRLDLRGLPRALRDLVGAEDQILARFDKAAEEGVTHVERTHPLADGLANYVLETALDPVAKGAAKRAGATRTDSVKTRTTLLLVRFRFQLVTRRGNEERQDLAEECRLAAFSGSPAKPEWIADEQAEALLSAAPRGNIAPEQAEHFIRQVVNDTGALWPHIENVARARADALLAAHRRVREAARIKGIDLRVEPLLPADIVGIYVLLPAPEGSR